MYLKSVDLDNFPTNETAQRMLKRVSPIYDNSYVAKWLYQVMGIELEEMERYIKTLPFQRFPETVTWAIEYLEQKYDIVSDETLSLEERRRAIIDKRPQRGSITPYRIEEAVKDISGQESEVEEDIKNYFFGILMQDTTANIDYAELVERLNKIVPSHLQYALQIKNEIKALLQFGTVITRDINREKLKIKADSDAVINDKVQAIYSAIPIQCREYEKLYFKTDDKKISVSAALCRTAAVVCDKEYRIKIN